jgi:hypothetical protein
MSNLIKVKSKNDKCIHAKNFIANYKGFVEIQTLCGDEINKSTKSLDKDINCPKCIEIYIKRNMIANLEKY